MTKDYNERDQILFGEDYDEDWYGGGTRHFKGLWAVDARKLIELGFLDPQDMQNWSPTVENFVEFMEKYEPYHITAHGYAVSQMRGDCRVSIEGLEYYCVPGDMNWDLVEDFVYNFRGADDFEISENHLYCWYD